MPALDTSPFVVVVIVVIVDDDDVGGIANCLMTTTRNTTTEPIIAAAAQTSTFLWYLIGIYVRFGEKEECFPSTSAMSDTVDVACDNEDGDRNTARATAETIIITWEFVEKMRSFSECTIPSLDMIR